MAILGAWLVHLYTASSAVFGVWTLVLGNVLGAAISKFPRKLQGETPSGGVIMGEGLKRHSHPRL